MVFTMFKQFFLLALVVSFSCIVFADISVVEPFEFTASDQEVVDLGIASSGDVVQIIVSTETNGEAFWSALEVESLPVDWTYIFSVENEKRIFVSIMIPRDAAENVYEFRVSALRNSPSLKEYFVGKLEVRNKVVSGVITDIDGSSKDYFVGENKRFKVSLTNSAVTNQEVLIYSSLSRDWLEPMAIMVPKKQTVEVIVPVTARVHGRKDFSLNVKSGINDFELESFDAFILARPTLVGKISATSLGFPFFTPSLVHIYFFNSIIGSFFG
mgnify:CR=1 FL=1